MRILKQLLKPCVVSVIILVSFPLTYAQNEPASTPCVVHQNGQQFDVNIDEYVFDNKAFLMHNSTQQSGLSAILLSQKAQPLLEQEDALVVLNTYTAKNFLKEGLRAPQRDSHHLQDMIHDREKSIVFLGLFPDLVGSSRQDAMVRFKTLLTRDISTSLDQRFFEHMCQTLPSGHGLVFTGHEHKTGQYDQWGFTLLDHEQQAYGVLSMYLHSAHQIEHVKSARRLHGLMLFLLGGVIILAMVAFFKHRRRSSRPVWSDGMDLDLGAEIKALSQVSRTEDLDAWRQQAHSILSVTDSADLVDVYVTLLFTQFEVVDALHELARMKAQHMGLWRSLFRESADLEAESALYTAQVRRMQQVREMHLHQPADFHRLFGYTQGHEGLKFIRQFELLVAEEFPDFGREHRLDLWMSYLERWYLLVDLLLVEVKLRLEA